VRSVCIRHPAGCRFSFVALLLLATYSLHAAADQLVGRVVKVSDGDTVTVLDAAKQQHRVRLAGIDAPEKGQPFGTRSQQSLGDLAAGQRVVVDWHKRDRYGRLVGKLLVAGVDVGLEQVRRGMAWHYKVYAREQSPADQAAYTGAEVSAKGAKRGLWRDPNPIEPWEWRRA
jgi:endonuclease YncB( thermonuclease family)